MPEKDNFQNSFLGPESGFDVLLTRMKTSKHVSNDILQLFKERSLIEEDYARKLAKLAKAFNSREEIGSLRDSIDVVKTELEESAKAHFEASVAFKNTLEKPLADFIYNQNSVRKNHQNNMERIIKSKAQLTASVLKSKERYDQKCLEVVQLNNIPKQNLQPKDFDKIKKNLEKATQQASQCDFDYIAGCEKLSELHKKYIQDFLACCSDCQKLEEARIDFLRSHLWSFANLISTLCVSDDEGCERIRLSLEKCDIEKDIQLFISKNSTGKEIMPCHQYVNYYGKSEKSEKRKDKEPYVIPKLEIQSQNQLQQQSLQQQALQQSLPVQQPAQTSQQQVQTPIGISI